MISSVELRHPSRILVAIALVIHGGVGAVCATLHFENNYTLGWLWLALALSLGYQLIVYYRRRDWRLILAPNPLHPFLSQGSGRGGQVSCHFYYVSHPLVVVRVTVDNHRLYMPFLSMAVAPDEWRRLHLRARLERQALVKGD